MSLTARTAVQAATAFTSKAFTLPAGTVAGDFVAFTICVGATNQTVSQSGGTGAFTLVSGNDTGTGTYIFGYRVMQSGDTAPTISWTTSAGYNSIIEAWTPTGNAISVDQVSAVAQSNATTSVTPNSLTGAGSGEGSLILVAAIASTSSAQSSHTYTPSSGWTNRSNSESTSNPLRLVAVDDNLSTSAAAVAPGSLSNTDSGSNTFNFNVLHILVNQTGGPAAPAAFQGIAQPGPAWKARWRPTGRPQLPLFYPVIVADSDASGAAADGGELAVADADAGSCADAGELVTAVTAVPAAATVRPSRTWREQFGDPREKFVVPVFIPCNPADAEACRAVEDARVFPQPAILILPAV